MSTRIPPLLGENKGVKQFPLLNSGEKSASIEKNTHFLHSLHSLLHSLHSLLQLFLTTPVKLHFKMEIHPY